MDTIPRLQPISNKRNRKSGKLLETDSVSNKNEKRGETDAHRQGGTRQGANDKSNPDKNFCSSDYNNQNRQKDNWKHNSTRKRLESIWNNRWYAERKRNYKKYHWEKTERNKDSSQNRSCQNRNNSSKLNGHSNKSQRKVLVSQKDRSRNKGTRTQTQNNSNSKCAENIRASESPSLLISETEKSADNSLNKQIVIASQEYCINNNDSVSKENARHNEFPLDENKQCEFASPKSYNSIDQSESKVPKISVIPLSKLIRNELLVLTEDNLNSFNTEVNSPQPSSASTTPNKRILRPNLVKRRRQISTCSSSSNPTDTIVDKVASMDKVCIKNVINSCGTKYDEALKLQARKRLREEIRRQLKSMNVEQPKTSANTEFIPDEIVDSIHIPDVVLDEIRKAFGIEIFNPATSVSLPPDGGGGGGGGDDLCKLNGSEIITIDATENEDAKNVSRNELQKSKTSLMNRLKVAAKVKSNSNAKEPPTNGSLSSNAAPQIQKATSNSPREKRAQRKCKSLKDNSDTNGLKNDRNDIILIESSSSSSESSSTSASSSSSSSSSDTESESNHSASVKRRRLKLRIDAENVVDSFEKLILPNLNDSLRKRYDTKYSSSLTLKLHFISCICTSEYNSKKFMKIEIATIQRNLKAADNTMALEFLMREIVNVFNKQKQIVKKVESKSKKSSDQMKPQTNGRDENECSEIEAATAVKSKSANAAEKVTTDDGEGNLRKNKINSSSSEHSEMEGNNAKMTESSSNNNKNKNKSNEQSTETTHQSVKNGQTLIETAGAIVGKNAGVAKATHATDMKEAGKNDDGKTQNCIRINQETNACESDYNNRKVDESSADNTRVDCNIKEKTTNVPQSKSCGEEVSVNNNTNALAAATNRMCGTDYINSIYRGLEYANISMTGNGLGCISSALIMQNAQFPTVDLEALRQQNILGDTVVNNLRELDLKLMELHKRKMFIEEMILKLQKDKMDTELQAIQLQNEKFLLLNTALTTNATKSVAEATLQASSRKECAIALKAEDIRSSLTCVTKCTVQKKTTTEKNDVKSNVEAEKSKKSSNLKSDKVLPKKSSKSDTKSVRKRRHTSPEEKNRKERHQKKLQKADVIAAPATDAPEKKSTSAGNDDNANTNASDNTIDATQTVQQTTEKNNYTDLSTGCLEGIKSAITQIRLFEDFIIASSEDGNLYKYNIRTLQLEKQFAKHSEAITQMYLCIDKKVLYTTSLDGYFKKTTLENFELDIKSIYLQEPLQSIDVKWGVAFIGSRWGNIFTYDTTTNNLADSLLCTTETSITSLKATKEGPRKILIVSSKGNIIHFRDAESGLLLRTLSVPEHLHIYSLLLDEACIYCGTQKKEIYKFDFTTGLQLSTLTCGNGAVSMQLYKNKFVFVGCYDGFIYVIDKETDKQIARFPGSGKMVLALEIAGDKIITSAKDKTMKIIDIPHHLIKKSSP